MYNIQHSIPPPQKASIKFNILSYFKYLIIIMLPAYSRNSNIEKESQIIFDIKLLPFCWAIRNRQPMCLIVNLMKSVLWQQKPDFKPILFRYEEHLTQKIWNIYVVWYETNTGASERIFISVDGDRMNFFSVVVDYYMWSSVVHV